MSNRSRKADMMGRRRERRWRAGGVNILPRRYLTRSASHVVRTPGIGRCRLGPAIYHKWIAHGGAGGPLGLPVLDEQPMPDGRGRFALFEWGGIYAAPLCGVHAVYGVLFDRWLLAGGAPDLFGYPCTDVLPTADGHGRFCHFEFGTLYTYDGAAVCAVFEPVRSTWLMLRGPGRPAVATLVPAPDAHCRGYGHWLMNNGAHGDPSHHGLCGFAPHAVQLLPQ